MSAGPNPDALVDEQIAYYRARAPEYDEWWLRLGQYEALAEEWEADKEELLGVLREFDPRGRVLELAAGTGNFTALLASTAEEVTAVDSSPEALAIMETKLPAAGARVECVVADIFEWRPSRRYDVVSFSFWLSHVPPARFDAFWEVVADALQPGGRVFFADNRNPGRTDRPEGTSDRELNDGRRFTIVKRFWEPEELRSVLGELGWDAEVASTSRFFLYGWATRS